MPPELQNAAHRQVMAGGPAACRRRRIWNGRCAAIRPRTSCIERRRARGSYASKPTYDA
jgi:hypothetical protein